MRNCDTYWAKIPEAYEFKDVLHLGLRGVHWWRSYECGARHFGRHRCPVEDVYTDALYFKSPSCLEEEGLPSWLANPLGPRWRERDSSPVIVKDAEALD